MVQFIELTGAEGSKGKKVIFPINNLCIEHDEDGTRVYWDGWGWDIKETPQEILDKIARVHKSSLVFIPDIDPHYTQPEDE